MKDDSKRIKKQRNYKTENNEMVVLNCYLSLNVNRSNYPIKWHRVAPPYSVPCEMWIILLSSLSMVNALLVTN
jgi:hypothetical protein